jgi:hypothetical protein
MAGILLPPDAKPGLEIITNRRVLELRNCNNYWCSGFNLNGSAITGRAIQE